MPFPEKWNMKRKYNLAFKISFIAFTFPPFSSMFCGGAAIAQIRMQFLDSRSPPKDIVMRPSSVGEDVPFSKIGRGKEEEKRSEFSKLGEEKTEKEAGLDALSRYFSPISGRVKPSRDRELTENRDAYKFLSKKLHAELEAAWKEHADLVEQVRRFFEVSDDESDTMPNVPNPQVQKKLDQIEQLQVEVDTVKAEAEEWKRNMDRFKEKALVHAKIIEELQSQLSSAVSGQENLAKELEAAKSEVTVVKAEADERVAQHKADAEAAQNQVRNIVEHTKWQSRREALEGVHARGFDLLPEIENAKVFEAKAKKLAYPEEEDSDGSKDSGESEGDGDPKGDDAAPDEE
ncbi:uncharacterized protein [Nicotiana tomentosiformis]|uniref:uncharacterized protein n=1 Tax=Nicotiana tomentosiformis TaxID=4098 RepID=UPI00388C8878